MMEVNMSSIREFLVGEMAKLDISKRTVEEIRHDYINIAKTRNFLLVLA
ncbi:hypothetical protein N752_11655 [Desulforamulus aquiferis]|nr:hypothetical protein N752_11655 [Desulforamulus aquiferis]